MGKISYEIITTIKESDKGNVYLAKVEGYAFPVVVKLQKHGNRAVFKALKEMKSEHLPQIYEIEETEDGLLVAEEYIEGELLADYLAAGKLTEKEELDIAKQLCGALKALHMHLPPLIHRDIKPSNVIINSKGVVKLIDFDSSRLYKEESEGDTRLLGTEKYAAPEQYGFSQTDCRSDIYSLGVVFGKFPGFASVTKKKHWKELVEKCTLFAPESRYQSVFEIEKELERLEKAGGRRWLKIGIATVSVLVLVGIGLLLPQLNKEKDTKETNDTVVTTAPEPGPTPTAEPGPSPTPTAEPKPNSTPTTDPEPSPTPTNAPEEAYRTTKPEWRDVETDPETYVELKQKIRDRNLVVMYCFKDRLSTNFLVQVKELEKPGAEFFGIRLTSYETNREFVIEEKFVEFRDGVVQIDDAYMKSLAEGYYKIGVELRRAGESGSVEAGTMLYVAESDVLEEPDWCLQNTTFMYYGDEEEKINVVLKNDSGKVLSKLLAEQNEEVDTSLYRLHCDGRSMELSDELLRRYCNSPATRFFVVCTDGSTIEIRIDKSELK